MPASDNRRHDTRNDRRRVPRGGRRPADRAGRHPTVLVADSCDPVRRLFVQYLSRFSFKVVEATNGDELLAVVNAAQPYLILTELVLPRMPAWRLTQWLGNNYRTRDIPIIVMASEFSEELDVRLERPAAAVLFKPFSLVAMLDEVRRALRRQMTSPS